MSTQRIYTLPVETTQWKFDGATEIQFNWEYDDGSDGLLELYDKGKKQQWDASTRLDWAKTLPFVVPTAGSVAEAGADAVSDLECLYWVGCAAAFDGLQHTFLSHRQRLGMRLAKRLAMGAHNVSNFQCRPHKNARLLLGILDGVRE